MLLASQDSISAKHPFKNRTGWKAAKQNTCIWYPRKKEVLKDNNAVNYTFDSFSKGRLEDTRLMLLSFSEITDKFLKSKMTTKTLNSF